MRANSFLICLASPVLHKMLCGSFSESKGKKLILNDVDGKIFIKTLDVWCGFGHDVQLDEMQQVASVADQFQISDVAPDVEKTIMQQLSVENCGEVLMWSGGCGMRGLETEALKMAVERFEEFARTAGFMQIGGKTLERMVDDERLIARNEKVVWEAVVRWMRGAAGLAGRNDVVGKIRFPLMREEYLRSQVTEMVSREDRDWMAGVVAEALRAQAALREGVAFQVMLLGRKTLAKRVGLGVRWVDYRDGEEMRLEGHGGDVRAILLCDEQICSGSEDGSIRVWSRASGEHLRTFTANENADMGDGSVDPVVALAVWESRLISGHGSGKLRAWNLATGECESLLCDQILAGEGGDVSALAVCGPRLASGSCDNSIKVWVMSPEADVPWRFERLLRCQRRAPMVGGVAGVFALAGWQDKLLSGHIDGHIRVWDLQSGGYILLPIHSGAVLALAVHRDRLLSAASDGSIRASALGTWEELQTVEAGRDGMGYRCCLAVSGSAVIRGSNVDHGPGFESRGEVRVWGLEELDLQETLRQPAHSNVHALLGLDGEVWGGVGRNVVVWGRRP